MQLQQTRRNSSLSVAADIFGGAGHRAQTRDKIESILTPRQGQRIAELDAKIGSKIFEAC
jgi:hypothetical protein